jgi:hypothetical protein
MILYGEPGVGKTFIAQRIRRVMNGNIYIPHALFVGNEVVRLYDPAVHEAIAESAPVASLVASDTDARYVLCKRPAVTVGGELTLEMLELSMDPIHRVFQSPVHLKANNGVFLIDDLGRQRVAVEQLFNRWIVPLEERRDFMTMAGGGRFEVPLDFVLTFSTNVAPHDLADEAFLRRLGYKIRVSHLDRTGFEAIWRKECLSRHLAPDETVFEFLVEELYTKHGTHMLACHPRDLLGIVGDYCRFQGEQPALSIERIKHAWNSYFVTRD